MGIETERKFLVDGDFLSRFTSVSRITQGYLSRDPERTVRIRLNESDAKAFLTIKGKSTPDGLSRAEWEYEVPYQQGEQMLKICGSNVLSKVRYLVPIVSYMYTYTYEVDVFLGMNQGLVVAEVEFNAGDPYVPVPDWVGQEVTGDPRYYNSELIDNPYTKW